ncbi:TcdA/TcdB pore-forming domain-containing protein [Pigmentibacter sp. JX0631]|uniref:TcdA/TcdB pore-forming domain-containing protein n=1 Tax=Pigmentibacter sp. JX0631 TaxID=2976982 RepID=UPI00246983D8|nr:TcdA/TcdB pore-forming domain-containing protein [Pigmentibacter sp. JX0631]WGL60965.1 TcdA/TcdB pore-forming domain-containing protein [Pigmentibacter sp. JX0631]
MFIKNKIYKFIFLFFYFIFLNGCEKNTQNQKENTEKYVHLSKNFNDTIVIDSSFIAEFKESMKNEISVPSNYDFNTIDKLSNFQGKTVEEQYKFLSEFINELPRPYFDSVYYQKYKILAANLEKLYISTAKPVAKNLHFIWLGGPLGEAQIDYVKIWAKINPDYQVQIWYDSQNLFTYETQKSFKEYLDITLAKYKYEINYENRFSDKYVELQNQLLEYFSQELIKNKNATKDTIRANFIDKEIYKKPNEKLAEKKYLENVKKMNQDIEYLEKNFNNLKFKNIRNVVANWDMLKIFEHELDLRFNFAAGSDIFRLYIVDKFAGAYADIDLLPTMIPIYELIAKNSTLKNYFDLPLAKDLSLSLITQAFFNEIILNNKNLIPSYKITENNSLKLLKSKINFLLNLSNLDPNVKEAIKNLPEEIERIAKDPKYLNVDNLFFKLEDQYVREGEFKIIRGNNSFILSHSIHSNEHWLQQLIDLIKSNYLQIFTNEKNNPGFKLPSKETNTVNKGAENFYRYDTLMTNIDSTISISGPYVYNKILDKVAKINPSAEIMYLNKIFNSFTPEASVSSWFKRSSDFQKSRQNLILQLGQDENTKTAAKNIYNKLKENSELYFVENDNFDKYISEKEKDRIEKLKEMSESDVEDENEVSLINERELNRDLKNKIEIHVVGHSKEVNNSLLIGGIAADLLAKKIKDNLFKTTNSQRLDYISLVSCNPSKNANDILLLENYAKNLLTSLNDLEIPVQIVSIRTTDVRVDKNGDKFYLHDNKYTGHKEGDKFYVYRKNKQDFLTIKATYLPEDLDLKKLSENKDNLRSVAFELNEIVEEGSSGPLGDLPSTLKSMQKIYSTKAEAKKYAKYIKEFTENARNKYKLSKNFAPILSTLNAQEKQISFINSETGELKKNIQLSTDESIRINQIWNAFSNEIQNVKNIPIKTDENGVIKNMGEGDGLGITPLLLAQTIYGMYKKNSSNGEDESSYDPALSKLIKAQNYLIDVQLTTDILQKIKQTEEMISALIKTNVITNEGNFMPRVDQVVNKLTAARYLTPGFSVAAAALDAFEYSYAVGSQKGIFATQFSFDTINASMSLGSLALGEGVASSVLGYIGTPFAGLAIGFTGFASAAIEAQEESIQIAKFFNEFLKDHSRYGKLSDCSPNLNIISLAHSSYSKSGTGNCSGNLNSAVIKKIDFTSGTEIKITYGSHFMHKTKNWHKGIFNSYFSNFQGSSKFPTPDPVNKFNIRETLDLPSVTRITLDENTAIVLPFLMEKTISYTYSYTPGIMTRHNSELEAVNKISENKNAQFVFRYFVDLFEYSVRNLHFETENSDIHIALDNKNRTLLTPVIPSEYTNKIRYNIDGGNGKYTLEVGKNATYSLFVKTNDVWTIDLSSLKNPLKFVKNNSFSIGENTKIFISGKMQKNLTIKENNKTYQINPSNGKITNIFETEVTESDQSKFLNELKNLAATFPEHEGLIKVNHIKQNGIDKSAWYDFGKNELYSPFILNEQYFNFSKFSLLGKKDNLVYYYDKQSGLIFKQNLLVTNKENTIPIVQVSRNSEPFFDIQHNTLIYKNSESSIPGIFGDWEFTIARIGEIRNLLKIDVKESARFKMQPRLIEALLKVQRSFHISQPVKVTDKNNDLIAWFINSSEEIPGGKLIVLSNEESKEMLSSEYAGFLKKSDGKFVYYFTSRDPKTLSLSLYQREENQQKATKVKICDNCNELSDIKSISIVNHKPVILTNSRYLYTPNTEGEFFLTGVNFSLSEDKAIDLSEVMQKILLSNKKHFEVLSLTDSYGSFAWYDIKKDIIILFDSTKKYLGSDDLGNYYFLDEYSNKLYTKPLKKGNLKNYSLEYENSKIKINLKNMEDQLVLQKNNISFINLNKTDHKKNNSSVTISEGSKVLAESFDNFEKREREKALESYNNLINATEFKIEQDKLDAQVPAGGTKRRSIIFVNDGWYNSSIEIVVEHKNGEIENFHSWWGQKSNFTVTPLVPISAKKITISLQSYLFGWSSPFFVRDFSLSDFPLCVNSTGTLFNRSATVRNCNEKH